MGSVFEARWTAPGTWHVRTAGGGWIVAPGTWKEDEAPAAVRRVFGPQETKGARVVVVTDGVKAP
jgi:hypothetical protein